MPELARLHIRDYRQLVNPPYRIVCRSVRERATALGGSLVVDSSEKGARVEIAVPLGAKGA